MPGHPLETAAFTADGATQARTMAEYAAGDVINVLNYIPAPYDPVGGIDVLAYLQAAAEAAFGPTNNPNGDNTALNKALYLPSGNYNISDTWVLPAIKNGHIFGDVSSSIGFLTSQSNKSVIKFNGLEGSLVENLGVFLFGTNVVGFDIDWDGDTGFGVGLKNNFFRKLQCGGGGSTSGNIAYRIGNGGFGGDGNAFWNVIGEATGIGFQIQHGESQSFQALCGGSEDSICWQVNGGSIGTIVGISNAGAAIQLDIQINNASTINVSGGRSEACRFIELNNSGAVAILSGLGVGNTDNPVNAALPSIVMVNGSKIILDGYFTGNPIEGEGSVYKRGGVLGSQANFTPTGPSAPNFEQDI